VSQQISYRPIGQTRLVAGATYVLKQRYGLKIWLIVILHYRLILKNLLFFLGLQALIQACGMTKPQNPTASQS